MVDGSVALEVLGIHLLQWRIQLFRRLFPCSFSLDNVCLAPQRPIPAPELQAPRKCCINDERGVKEAWPTSLEGVGVFPGPRKPGG